MVLSIIIPTRNRAKRVSDLLDSLARQEPVSFEWEVIVIDNASTDDTAEITRQKINSLPINVRYIFESKLGLHQGRNRGAKEANGEFLGYLDDDMILSPTWIQGIEQLVQDHADAVVGRILPKWEADPPGWLSLITNQGINGYLGLLDLGIAVKPVDPIMVFGGNCFLPRKQVFELGGFHPDSVPVDMIRYRGDGETGLMMRFKQKGLHSFYDPKATAFHVVESSRLTIEYICKRAYNQGISDSFTQIRAAHGLTESSLLNSSLKSRYEKFRQKSLNEIVKTLIRKTKKAIGSLRKEPYAEIRDKIAKAYQAGWQFHQNEVKNDPELFEYVLKENYMD